MSWNGETVIDLDSHIVERVDRFYDDYIDPAYRDHYRHLCDAVAHQAKAGHRYSLFGSRTSVIHISLPVTFAGVTVFGYDLPTIVY